jgi:Uma2 family endonuclease
MTLAEYQATPTTVRPQELIYGALRAADAPLVNHQRVVFRLARAMQAHVEAAALGEVFVAPIDVILDTDRALVLQPDLLFVSRERDEIVHDRIYGAPDLVVEVLSPNPRIGKLDERINWFAEYGAREIWIYHQNDKRLDIIFCDERRASHVTSFTRHAPIRSRVLPGFGAIW